MANKLLSKVIDDLGSLPSGELEKLVRLQMDEADMLEGIIGSLPEGHIVFSPEQRIVFINNAAYHLLPSDRRRRMKPGLKAEELLIDQDVKKFILAVFSGNEKAEPQDFAFSKGNEIRTERVSFTFLSLPGGRYTDVVIRDITEEIMNETRLRRSESLASMTTMAAGIAHEIKNPLAAMKIHLHLMRKTLKTKGSIDSDGAERYLSVLDEEIDHLNKIAVDFLFAVRPMNIELRLGSIESVVNDLITFLSPEADEKNIEVVSDVEKFLPRIEMDSRYLRQSLLNIVENAFAHISPAVFCGRKEIHAHELMNRSLHSPGEELRNNPRLTFADEHSDHLMPMRNEHVLESHGLRQMPTALSLHDKKVLHD